MGEFIAGRRIYQEQNVLSLREIAVDEMMDASLRQQEATSEKLRCSSEQAAVRSRT